MTAYQIDGLVSSITDPGSNVTSLTYNNMRRLWKRTDAESRVTEFIYDELSRITTVKDAATNTAEMRVYTDNGQLESVEDAEGNVTDYEYDGFDRLKKTIFEDATYEQLTYDANSNITSRRTRAGDVIDLTYDVLNRLTQKDPDNMPVVSFEYDLAGRRTKVSTAVVSGNPASGDFDFSYDTAGRLTAEESPDGKDVSYQLDANGNVTRLTHPDGFYVEYVYDKLNRLTDVKLNGAGSSALAFEYDNLSRRTKLTYENGVVTDYALELDDDMSTLEHAFDASSVQFSYGFNDAHELTSQDVDDSAFLWHPTTGGTVSYGAANSLNQYPSVGGTNHSYNNNGCLTDDGVFDYTYDTENQLVEADNGTTVSSYIYDPMRRQAQKNVGGTKTRYIYSGFQRIEDYDGSDNLVRRFVYGVGHDEALIEIDSGGDKTYLHHDRAGSIVATTDDTGAVLNTYAYSPFGECDSMSGTSIGFTGQRFDPETGLYYYKNRHYKPSIGRFLQPDPIGYADSLNLYQYAFNAPLDFTDPLGLSGTAGNKPWTGEPPVRDPFRLWGYKPSLQEIFDFINNGPAKEVLNYKFGEALRNYANEGLKNFEAGASGPIYDGLLWLAQLGFILATFGLGAAAFSSKGKAASSIVEKVVEGQIEKGAPRIIKLTSELLGAAKGQIIDGTLIVNGSRAEVAVGNIEGVFGNFKALNGLKALARSEGATELLVHAETVENTRLANILTSRFGGKVIRSFENGKYVDIDFVIPL